MGIKEIIVIGQDTTAYGIDLYGEYKLPLLLSRLAKETEVQWLRILYCYPEKITDELIEEFKTNSKLVKYIDLPIQHINDKILKRMNRRGNSDTIKNAIKRLREIEGMVIRSTAIVGFPGETEEEFLELCQFIREVKFEHFGAFAYSREEGTPAYRLPDQIDDEIKQKREEIIMREQQSVYDELSSGQEGKIIRVLTEGYDNLEKRYIARAYTDAPEIDDLVFYQSKIKHSVGDFVSVRIDEIDDHNIYATEV